MSSSITPPHILLLPFWFLLLFKHSNQAPSALRAFAFTVSLLGTLIYLQGLHLHFTSVSLLKHYLFRGAFLNWTTLKYHLAHHCLPPYPALLFFLQLFSSLINNTLSLREGVFRIAPYWWSTEYRQCLVYGRSSIKYLLNKWIKQVHNLILGELSIMQSCILGIYNAKHVFFIVI